MADQLSAPDHNPVELNEHDYLRDSVKLLFSLGCYVLSENTTSEKWPDASFFFSCNFPFNHAQVYLEPLLTVLICCYNLKGLYRPTGHYYKLYEMLKYASHLM